MGSNSPESKPPKPGGLLARLFGMSPAPKAADEKKPAVPPPDQAGSAESAAPPPVEAAPVMAAAAPVERFPASAAPPAQNLPSRDFAPAMKDIPVLELDRAEEPVPTLTPTPAAAAVLPPEMVQAIAEEQIPVLELDAEPPPSPPEPEPVAITLASGENMPVEADGPPTAEIAIPVLEPPPLPQLCPICSAPRKGEQSYCDDCGWMFPPDGPAVAVPLPAHNSPAAPTGRIQERYEVGELLGERDGLCRYRGLDYGADGPNPVPVIILRMVVAEAAAAAIVEEAAPAATEDSTDELEILPSFDEPVVTALPVATWDDSGPPWPSIAWEKAFLEKAQHPAIPRVLAHFTEAGFDYLVVEAPAGRSLWDAWDDPEASSGQRYGLLGQVAAGLHKIHEAGAIFEGLRPDLIVVADEGQVRFASLGDLIPYPLPPHVPVRVSLYTPPELVLSADQVDLRADLYSFGAMLYALEYLHHDLSESDFERQFSPKLITDRFPDVHPAFFRLISKTFNRDPNGRFPTDEAVKEDSSGITELIRTLETCGRAFDSVRLDIAAWTTTGMVRTGNEDAFALLHGVESRQDELGEYALLLLADGMGGYEAGEVAAAMAIQALRKNLLQQKMFAALAGQTPPPADEFNVEGCKKLLLEALRFANREVYTASRTPGVGKRGMGCTAEAVYVDAYNVVVGHVGDSRTYHLHQGRLVQLTRDQTFVNRMVELKKLTPEEAENHPRKNELQQAIGGQPEVQPGLYHGQLLRGDWVLVCSDGLSNHVPPEDLQKMLLREATSAEEAARRLLNMVNLRGATDNATVVIIRAC
jgi:protein phosphatase